MEVQLNKHFRSKSILYFAFAFIFTLVLLSRVHAYTFYNGYRWDLNNYYFYIGDGSNDAYDNAYYLEVWCSNTNRWQVFYSNHYHVNDSTAYGYETNWRLMCNNAVNVTRYFYVNKSSTEHWARYVDCVENIQNSPITIRIQWRGNLGSDWATHEYEHWYLKGQLIGVGTDDWDGTGDPSLAHIFGFNFTWRRSVDNIYMTSNEITLAPHQRVCFVLFAFQEPNEATARSDVSQLIAAINTSNLSSKFFTELQDYLTDIVNLPLVIANVTLTIIPNQTKLYPDQNFTVKVILNITNVTSNLTLTVNTFLYDIVSKSALQQYNTTINVSTNETVELEYNFTAPPLLDYYYICSKVTGGIEIERCVRIEVTLPVQLLFQIRNMIEEMLRKIENNQYTLRNIYELENAIYSLNNQTYELLQNLTNESIEMLNATLSNISMIQSQLDYISANLSAINETLYSKLLELQSNLSQMQSTLKQLIEDYYANLTDQLNETKQLLLQQLTVVNNNIEYNTQLLLKMNETLQNITYKLNDLYNVVLELNQTQQLTYNKTLEIIKILSDLNENLYANFSKINDVLQLLINKLKGIFTFVKPTIIVSCPKNVTVGKTVTCNVTVLLNGKPIDIPVSIYIQKTVTSFSFTKGLETKTITVMQFDKIYVINGKGQFSFVLNDPGNYTIIVRNDETQLEDYKILSNTTITYVYAKSTSISAQQAATSAAVGATLLGTAYLIISNLAKSGAILVRRHKLKDKKFKYAKRKY